MNPNLTALPLAKAVSGLYGAGSNFAAYLDTHITTMAASDKPMVSRTGTVLEAAKLGFGIGLVTPTAIIALGQMLLGNPLQIAVAVGTVPFHPVSMTCAAVGAIYFGWSALEKEERNTIIERVAEGLKIGAELVKAIVHFVVGKLKDLASEESIAEYKRMVAEVASSFGRTLSDITQSIKDKAEEAYEFVASKVAREPDYDPSKLPPLIKPKTKA